MEETYQKETPETPITPGAPKEGKKDLTAILSYIGILVLIPLLTSKDDPFTQFHARQGLALFVAEIATFMIAWIPFLGWFVGMILWIVWLVLSIMGIMNVLNGKRSPLPVIGKLAEKFQF